MFKRYSSPSILKENAEERTYSTPYGDVSVAKMPNGLKIKIADENFDKDQLAEDVDLRLGRAEHDFFSEGGTGNFFGNGWGDVPPEAIGALTEAPIITDDLDITDEGDVIPRGNIYWYPNYQVRSFLEDLLEKGETFFDKAE